VRGRVLSGSGDLPTAQAALTGGVELAQRGAGPLDVAWGTLTPTGVLAGVLHPSINTVTNSYPEISFASCPHPTGPTPPRWRTIAD